MAFERTLEAEDRPLAEINMTPLVDVMLVLLIIFMVTAPLFTHAVRIELPRVDSPVSADRPETIALSIDPAGTLRWNGEIVPDGLLPQRLAQLAGRDPQPEIQLRADRDTRYERLARVLAEVQRAGLGRLAFVTDPLERP